MRYFLLLSLILILQCFGQDEDKTEITPEDLMGVWVRVVEVSSDVPGLYKRDTVTYRIGLDPIVDTMSYVVYDKMSFSAQGRYTSYFGFMFRHWDLYGKNEYDYDKDIPYISFNLRLRHSTGYEDMLIRFSYTRDYPTDTIDVTVGGKTFGLKRGGL